MPLTKRKKIIYASFIGVVSCLFVFAALWRPEASVEVKSVPKDLLVPVSTASVTPKALQCENAEFSSNLPEWKQELLQHFAIALLSSTDYIDRLEWALKSWWRREFDSIVQVLSDSDENEIEPKEGDRIIDVPNVVNTECPSSYNFGLWCKDLWMLTRWREDARYAKVKWFYRGMDDSWLHLENLVWLSRQYDHRKAIVIGETVCEGRGTYPDGGPGFLISRGVIDHPQALHAWHEALAENGEQPTLDDVIWGVYMRINGIPLVHSNGFSHLSHFATSETYRYFVHQKDHGWPLNFRPVAYHQTDDFLHFMPEMDRALKEIDFAQPANDSYSTPGCYCRENHHRRCTWDKPLYDSLSDRGGCRWASQALFCLGPGPWPNAPDPVVDYSEVTPLNQAHSIHNNIKYLQQEIGSQRLEMLEVYQLAEMAPKITRSWTTVQELLQETIEQFENPPTLSKEEEESSIQAIITKIFPNKDERLSILKFCLSQKITGKMLMDPKERILLSQKYGSALASYIEEKASWAKLMAALDRSGMLNG